MPIVIPNHQKHKEHTMLRNTTSHAAKVNPGIDYARQVMILNYLLEGVLGEFLSDLNEVQIEEAIARVTRHLEEALGTYRLEQVFRNRATIQSYGAEMLNRLANDLPIEFAESPAEHEPELVTSSPRAERLAQARQLGSRVGQVAVQLGSRTGQVARRGLGTGLAHAARGLQGAASRLTPKG